VIISFNQVKPAHRQQEIISRLRAMQTELRVEDLARMLGVSGLTIRRDLAAGVLTQLIQYLVTVEGDLAQAYARWEQLEALRVGSN